MIGGADAALLYTAFSDTGTGALVNNAAYWQLVPQLGSELGLGWRTSDVPSFSVTFGGRGAASFNTRCARIVVGFSGTGRSAITAAAATTR